MAKEPKKPAPAVLSDGGGFDLTPMIDVVFLLIIFFMVITDITNRKPTLELPVAQAAEPDVMEDRSRLEIHIHESGAIETAHGKLTPKQVDEMIEWEAASSIDETGFPARVVLIRADRRAKYKDVQQVMAVCMRYGLWRIAFSTKQEQAN